MEILAIPTGIAAVSALPCTKTPRPFFDANFQLTTLLTSVRQAGTIRRGESESSRVTAHCPTAATLRVTQRRVRELVRGRIELFSIDTLIGMLCCLDVSVSVKIGRRPGRIVG